MTSDSEYERPCLLMFVHLLSYLKGVVCGYTESLPDIHKHLAHLAFKIVHLEWLYKVDQIPVFICSFSVLRSRWSQFFCK